MILEISVLAVLLVLSAIFSATETAFISLSVVEIEELAQKRGRRGRLVKKLVSSTDTLLTAILIGNNLVNIAASSITAHLTITVLGSTSLGFTTGILTLVILIFAEVTPKQIAIVHNSGIALFMVYFIRGFALVLLPVIKLITAISSFLSGLFKTGNRESVSLDGILHMVNLAENEGVVESYETRMVKSVFRFNDTSIQAIMTHRTEVFSLEKTATINDCLELISEKGYSRIPVYDDNPEDIVGILLIKDVLTCIKNGKGDKQIKEIMVDPLFVSGNRKVNELFTLFKSEKLNMAVIVDGYGGLLGIVTMEDVTEELFGELYDEHEERKEEKISHLSEGSYRILGDTSIQYIKDRLDLELPYSKNARTLGGFLVEYLGNIPVTGQRIETPYGVFRIENVENNRINSVLYSFKDSKG
ncbi:MAG: HlyC/CorC family transporter [Spirochaetes bacterium]|nr:MAG: HlyC/CorC family transporter [Spirochaetota bacterium]